jgi:Lsr2
MWLLPTPGRRGALPGSVHDRKPSGSGACRTSLRPPAWSRWPTRAIRAARTRRSSTAERTSRHPQKEANRAHAKLRAPRKGKLPAEGGEAAGTVRFGLDGTEYEIDLSAAHNDELRKALQQYLAHARRTGGTARTAARTRRGSATVDTAKVREWAKEQGIEVKDRGRVPANVVEQYQTAAGA